MFDYHLTPVTLSFAHIDGLKISSDKSTLYSKLEVRIINVYMCIVDGMVLVQSHVDFPSTFGCEANMTVSSCQACKIV